MAQKQSSQSCAVSQTGLAGSLSQSWLCGPCVSALAPAGALNPTAQTLNPQTSCSLKDRYCGVSFPAECSCAAKTARLHLRSRNPSPEQQYCFSWFHEFGRSSGEAKCKCPRRALRPNTPSMHSKPQHWPCHLPAPEGARWQTRNTEPRCFQHWALKLRHAGSHYTLLYYILDYAILYYTLLYYTILCYTIVYRTMLYHIVPYYTLPYYTPIHSGLVALHGRAFVLQLSRDVLLLAKCRNNNCNCINSNSTNNR